MSPFAVPLVRGHTMALLCVGIDSDRISPWLASGVPNINGGRHFVDNLNVEVDGSGNFRV